MGIFSRKHIDALVVAPEPEIVERPTVTADELERMVYETYREKLSLAQELAEKDATIARLKEQVDKLNAAETFSRQSESERRRLESEAKRLSDANDHLTEELRQERAKVSARDLKIMQLEKDSAALADERLAEFLRGMADEAEQRGYEKGLKDGPDRNGWRIASLERELKEARREIAEWRAFYFCDGGWRQGPEVVRMRAEKLERVEAIHDPDWTERGLRDAAREISKIADFMFGEEEAC